MIVHKLEKKTNFETRNRISTGNFIYCACVFSFVIASMYYCVTYLFHILTMCQTNQFFVSLSIVHGGRVARFNYRPLSIFTSSEEWLVSLAFLFGLLVVFNAGVERYISLIPVVLCSWGSPPVLKRSLQTPDSTCSL